MGAKSLAIEQMYNVLRGLPGTMELSSSNGDRFTLTVVNPNAPANRCQETLGLRIALEGPLSAESCTVVERVLAEQDLETLRSGEPLDLTFGDIEITFRSNPGGQLVQLPAEPLPPSTTKNGFEYEILRSLGKTGLPVFPVGLGAMSLSMNNPPPENIAIEVINAALESGVNFIDTANVYCSGGDIGHNERLIRKALKLNSNSKSVIVATKGGVDKNKGRVDASPDFLRSSCEQSLDSLGQDSITLYQLHSPDSEIPIEESVGALSRLQEEGKIVHIGLCNVTAKEVVISQEICRIESVQNCCNPFNAQDYFNDVLNTCKRFEMCFFPHSVLGGKSTYRQLEQNVILVGLGQKYGVSPYSIAVAWHLSKENCVVPIPGASKPRTTRSSAMAAGINLALDDVRRIDSIWLGEE
ncbi:MAG: aldo/keto reductase [Paracoccaceae bacterium]